MHTFEHMMRTSQHVKSVESIMTRTHNHFFNSKSPHRKLQKQGDNLTTYLRKFEINKENENLAKRILLCQSEHSRDKYIKQWDNVKRFMRVRSNFKKTLHAKQPKIYRFQPILGKGRMKVQFQVKSISLHTQTFSHRSLYRFSFSLNQAQQIEPDKKLITPEYIPTYATIFYAPSNYRNKKITCKILQVTELNYHEAAKFQIDLSGEIHEQQAQLHSRFGKSLGKISFEVKVEGGRRLKKKAMTEKENLPGIGWVSHHENLEKQKVCYYSQAQE